MAAPHFSPEFAVPSGMAGGAVHTPHLDQPPTVAIRVAGAFNAELGRFSTAGVHFLPLRMALKHAGVIVERSITPENFGIYGSLETYQERFSSAVDARLRRHGSEARPLLIGHSLGGLLVARELADRGYGAALTMGTPHGDLQAGSVLPRTIAKLIPNYIHRSEQIAEYAQETLELLARNPESAQNISFAGSSFDEMVNDVHVAIPEVPGAHRTVFTQLPHSHSMYNGAETITAPLMDHGGLMIHPSAVRYITRRAVAYAARPADAQTENTTSPLLQNQPASSQPA